MESAFKKQIKVLLINPPIRLSHPPSSFPHGIGYIAAVMLKEGYEVKILDINGYRYDKEKVKQLLNKFLIEEGISIVGIGCLITCYNYVKWLIQTIKIIKPKTKVIVGGGLGTSIPKMVIDKLNADIAVIGEGEYTMLELMDVFNEKKKINSVGGIYYKEGGRILKTPLRGRITNIDDLPLPPWHLFPMEVYLKNTFVEIPKDTLSISGYSMSIVSGRGCCYHCAFCFDALGHSRTLRSVEKVIEEVILLKKKYRVTYFTFTDPCFVIDKDWVNRLCDEIIKRKLDIKWITSGRVNLIDEELLRKMRAAGCLTLNYGVETGSQKILDSMKKGTTVEQAYKTVALTRKVGLKDWYNLMMGFPEETEEDLEQTIKFCIDNDLRQDTIFFVTPYPGTELYEQAKSRGLIKDEEEFISRLGEATEFTINLTRWSDEELLKLRDYAINKINKAYFKKHKMEFLLWIAQKPRHYIHYIKVFGLSSFFDKIKGKLGRILDSN